MNLDHLGYIVYIVLAPLAALGLSLLAISIWPHRRSRSIAWLLAVVIITIIQNIITTIELVLPSENGTLFFSHLVYLFIPVFPVVFMTFALEYVRPEWAKRLRPYYWLLYIIPAITALFAWLPETKMLWREYSFVEHDGLLSIDVHAYGPIFLINAIYGYATSLFGWGLLLYEYAVKRNTLYPRSKLFLAAAGITWLTNLLYLLRFFPTHKDYTSVAAAISLALITFGVLRERIFEMRPLSTLTLADHIDDGVLLVDAQNAVIDVNAAAIKILGRNREEILGQDARTLVGYFSTEAPRRELSFNINENALVCELTYYPLKNTTGGLLVLHDITLRKTYEQTLLENMERITNLYTASAALLQYTSLDDLLHTIVQKGRHLLKDCKRTIWYPLHEALPREELASPAGLEIPMLNLSDRPQDQPLPARWIEGTEYNLYLKPVQAGAHVFGVLAFEWPSERRLSEEERKVLDNFAVIAAAAIQSAVFQHVIEKSELTDPLTGALNRQGLEQMAEQHIFDSSGQPYTLLNVDLDKLSRINELYGRDAGDKAIKTLSDIIQANLRAGDVVSRYGDDSFLVVLPGQNLESAQRIALRLQQQTVQKRITDKGNTFFISVSIGIATVARNESMDKAVKRSERALKRAKQQGRNRIVVE